MDTYTSKDLPLFPNLKLAVVGHVEWISFIGVKGLPKPGDIIHASNFREEPAGGGAVAAIQLGKLTKQTVHFFTSLGKDRNGIESYKKLEDNGLKLHVAWKDEPTRKGISFVDEKGERTITVIGKRLQPTSNDSLPWQILDGFDGIFITATDPKGIQLCRNAKNIVATPRVGVQTLKEANIELDALVGSALDLAEQIPIMDLYPQPKKQVATEGAQGGYVIPGGRYKAVKLNHKIIDSYGCGDSFAAGLTAGLAAGWEINKALNLAAKCGAICTTFFGPYI